ncbi:hypothetical protein MKX08_003633 [Trichoderma sp. CBMAI-0020]|nr:hypothetical protein MKX08_003633 [Trichoderma sp. CBMAI-0020]
MFRILNSNFNSEEARRTCESIGATAKLYGIEKPKISSTNQDNYDERRPKAYIREISNVPPSDNCYDHNLDPGTDNWIAVEPTRRIESSNFKSHPLKLDSRLRLWTTAQKVFRPPYIVN